MIKELHQKLLSGKTTAVKLAEQYLKVIKEKDKKINAFLTLTEKLAMEQANEVDEKIKQGKEIEMLAGIPGAIKDNICIKNIRATSASEILDNYIAPYDATVIAKLKKIKAIFLGKTNLDEFAMGSSTENSAYALTKNPHDTQRVPGGSSGGSAAAVASREAVWALGSDTGGSIRQPASFCGVVGLKPTYGRVSRYGLMALASSLDQIGPLAQTVEDVAIILSAIAGRDKMDATSIPGYNKKYENYLTGEVKGLKIGVVEKYLKNLDRKTRNAIEKVIDKYKKLGVEIKKIELPYTDYALATYYIIQSSEASSNLARYDGIKYGRRVNDEKKSELEANGLPRNLLETYLDTRQYNLGKEVKRRIMLGTYSLSAGYYDAYYLRAQKVRTLIKKEFEKTFEQVDLILTPTTPKPAFKIGEKTQDPLQMYLADIFTIVANIAGVPAISVPGGKIDKKLPIGFQLMGKWFDEENLLRAADAWEKS